MNTTNVEVSTAPKAGEQGVVTNLTIDWSGVTGDEIQQLAQQALIVKLQGAWRKNGIPTGEHTVNAADYKIGVRAPRTKQTPEQLLAALTPEQRKELFAKFA